MRLQTVNAVGAVASTPVPLDYDKTWFGVGVAIYIVAAPITATVQFTFDDIWAAGYDPNAVSSIWFNHNDPALVASAVAAAGNFMFPVMACRLLNAAAGTAQLRVLQAGGR